MSNKSKDIIFRNYTYYFFDDINNKKIIDPNKIKIDEKPYKNIFIYYIGYMAITDSKYLKINNVNLLYLIINKVNKYPEEINKNKYLMPVPANGNKEITKKMKNCGVNQRFN